MADTDKLQRWKLLSDIFASYSGVVTALLVSGALGLATYLFNKNQLYINERQYCLTQHPTLIERLYGDKDVAEERRETRREAFFADLASLATECKRVDVLLPQVVQENVSTFVQSPSTSTAVREAALQVLEAAATNGKPPPRIYIYLANQDQMSRATDLKTKLQQNKIDGKPILVPPVQVKKSDNKGTELRCYTLADCAGAGPIVDILNQLLMTPSVVKKDLSSQPKLAAGNRPLHYELWFAPGPIELRS